MKVLWQPHKQFSWEFKLEDFWVGVFWKTQYQFWDRRYKTDVWVCLLPCLPFHLIFYRKAEPIEP